MIEFKNCLVAHIDVMGFKELLDGSEESNTKLARYFTKSKEFLTGKTSLYSATSPEDNFKSLFVSDSIILSVEVSENDPAKYLIAGRFFYTISLLQYVLAIEEQIWTRGAISIGPLSMNANENILVGQSFVNAYLLESTANYPRVIIDPRVFNWFNDTVLSFCNNIKSSYEMCRLIDVYPELRFGGFKFENDMVMIDWFSHILNRTEDYEPYFSDLEKRMCKNHELFKKSNKLVPYLWESFSRCIHDEEETFHIADKNRANLIESRISNLK